VTAATFPIRLRIGKAQEQETYHQRQIAVDEAEEYPHTDDWRIEGMALVVDTAEAGYEALYRITNGRDIARDNAESGLDDEYVNGARSVARSMQALTDRLVAALGGVDAIPADTRRWL
jgi:hypothetical protein